MNKTFEKLKSALAGVKENEPLAKYTTFKLGGPARYFVEAKNKSEVITAVELARSLQIPLFVFGGGSNMLVADLGFNGLVVRMVNRDVRFDGVRVIAGAGVPSGLLAVKSVEAGLTGLEWLVGLPGTIGGAVCGNAGMFGGEMKEVVESVLVLEIGIDQSAKISSTDVSRTSDFSPKSPRVISRTNFGYVLKTLENVDCHFGYRQSLFKEDKSLIILEATLKLAVASNADQNKLKLKQFLLNKKSQQPVEHSSAGCIFKNWWPSEAEDLENLCQYFGLSSANIIPVAKNGLIPAGWLIEQSGLKGFRVGKIEVSLKHANFMIQMGVATSADVVALIRLIKTEVSTATQGLVQLQEEVELVGF